MDHRPREFHGREGTTPQPYPFHEWAKIAGWTQLVNAKKLDGTGYETPEIEWQMGEDPYEVRRQNQATATDLASSLVRPDLERELALELEMERIAQAAERERLARDINRRMMPGLGPMTEESKLAVLLDELERLRAPR